MKVHSEIYMCICAKAQKPRVFHSFTQQVLTYLGFLLYPQFPTMLHTPELGYAI